MGCNSGTAVRFQEGLPTRPPPTPASHSVFLLLATQRPHWPHPPCGPAGSPPPPTPSLFPGSSVSFLAPVVPGVGRALTVRARASGPAAGTSRPAGAPQGGGDGGRGGGGAEVGGGQQGGGGGGGGQAGFAEAAGHGGGHQAAEGERARAVAGQALYGLRGAALLACSGHGAPWGLQDKGRGVRSAGKCRGHQGPTRYTLHGLPWAPPLLHTVMSTRGERGWCPQHAEIQKGGL